MSLPALIASYDDAALTATASKGVLIRARKDVSAGKVSLIRQDTDGATLDVVGETVVLGGKTLDAARCPCPATGICRHIIAAIIFLREQGETPQLDTNSPTDFAIEDVEKFAGADWPFACALAEMAQLPETSGSVVVTFTDSDAQVTFPQGMGLRQALYKGSVSAHKRRCIAAAALAIAHANGAPLPEYVAVKAKPTADIETLDRAAAALEMAAVSLAAGTFAQAQAHVYNVAISARAEAVPRLAAEMRGLSKRLAPEELRQATVSPSDLLGMIARTYALVDALRIAPDDPALVGVLARNFVPSGPKSLAFLGAETWQTPAGAKGLTMVFSDLADGRMHRATQARGAGTDLNFDPYHQWRTTLWSLAKPSDMSGRTVVLDDAAVAGDDGLGLTQTARFGPDIGLGDLGSIQTDWVNAAAVAMQQVGQGLRRRPGDAYLLFAPDSVSAVSFDSYVQKLVWDWTDPAGNVMTLTLPDNQRLEAALSGLVRRVKAGLVAFPPGGGTARLISIWLDGPKPGPFSLGLDPLPKHKGLGAMVDRFLERTMKRDESEVAPLDPLALFFERASEAVISGIAGKAGLTPSLMSDAQALGLGQILAAHEAWTLGKRTEHALRLAYVLAVGRDLARGQNDSNA